MKDKLNVVDLFCGCGGFGLGAEMAGFHTLVAVDIDETLQSAYKKNFPTTHVLRGDLATMNEESWRILLGDNKIDGVIGGPPCQGYSRMGKSDVNDPRRSLLQHFFRHVNIISPKFFVMENVEGLLDKKNIIELSAALAILDEKYNVTPPFIIDASEFGVPTKRKRVIVIGYDPLYMDEITAMDIYANKSDIKVNVRDAISDLPSPSNLKLLSHDKNFGWAKYKEDISISIYAQNMRKIPDEGMGWEDSIKFLKSGITSGFFDTIHTEHVKKRYSEVVPGNVDSISRSKRLTWEGVCPTLRAGTGADKGSYQAVRPLHPEDARVITIREAARLQGFPDWFVFHTTKWHSFRMIGNSVSPIVSYQILKVISEKISHGNICDQKERFVSSF